MTKEDDPLPMPIDDGESRPPLRQRLHVRLSHGTRVELGRLAGATGTPVSVAVRHLIEAGLKRTSTADAGAFDQSLVTLSTLVAAEQTLHLLEQIVPDGKRRSAEVRTLAPAAAEARLEELRLRLEEQL